jgi:hypothetical protein
MMVNDVTQWKDKDCCHSGEQCCKVRAVGWCVVTVCRVERVISKKKFKNLDLELLIFLEDEQSSEDNTECLEASDIFKRRATEGAYEILVRRHLHCNEDKFREYFRLTPVLFDYVLNYIKGDLTSKPYNRNKNPISPEQRLCVFLR